MPSRDNANKRFRLRHRCEYWIHKEGKDMILVLAKFSTESETGTWICVTLWMSNVSQHSPGRKTTMNKVSGG